VNSVQVLECYAYYLPDAANNNGNKVADRGTTLRFVERPATSGSTTALPLPGLVGVKATYDQSGTAAYADHWVSNVIDREGFLTTLEDCLGFTPKVKGVSLSMCVCVCAQVFGCWVETALW